jgi:hypothetical protein
MVPPPEVFCRAIVLLQIITSVIVIQGAAGQLNKSFSEVCEEETAMNRKQYEDYARKFNARDYDGIFDFYDEKPDLSFFGISIRTREELRKFYTFLHAYVKETITIEKFASSDELAAVEGVIRVEGIKDLDKETLDANGMEEFFPIKKGEVQEMRQYIHYHLHNGKIKSVGCAIVS